MARELCYLAVCERNVKPSIAGGYDIREVINLQPRFLECLSHDLVGELAMLGTGGTLDDRE
jgi:hypothetical protein